jgi:2-polyprenyl-3-methyl-5-hydroxy-6-metoxy-1,4-benzoquinol methylase
MSDCEELKQCVACGSNKLKLTLDLGKQPLANSYKLEHHIVQEEYPLAVNHCEECFHVQLTHAVNPALMFEDYLYVSGTTQTGREHFESFASFVHSAAKGKTVLDIGCNDGTQLDYFKKLGYNTFGVDPAKNLYKISKKEHTVFLDYFDTEFSSVFAQADISIDVITAQNVFAHTANPIEFLMAAKQLMHNESTLFIQTSQANMILNNEFDTIYHEHISFFNVQSMDKLCKRAGLFLVGVEWMPIHGTSFVFIIRKKNDGRDVDLLINEERTKGLYYPETYIEYAKRCDDIVTKLKYECDFVRQGMIGWNVVGYGAPAKGMTLLNYAKLNLDFIIDDNPLKQGRFTPGSSIPIYGPEKLDELKDTTLFVPLAWNFFDEIRARIKSRHDNKYDRFITYFPKVEIRE